MCIRLRVARVIVPTDINSSSKYCSIVIVDRNFFCLPLALYTVYLYGRSTKITDVGIHYGLGFKDLRELGIVGGAQVS